MDEITFPFIDFQAVCYSCLPKYKDEDGLVAFYINKPDKELSQAKDSLLTSLQSVIANSNVTVVIEGIRPLPDNRYACTYMGCNADDSSASVKQYL